MWWSRAQHCPKHPRKERCCTHYTGNGKDIPDESCKRLHHYVRERECCWCGALSWDTPLQSLLDEFGR